MVIWEETTDTPESMRRRGYRLLDHRPLEELSEWRTLVAQDHFIYDTAHKRVKITQYGPDFYVWVPEEEPVPGAEPTAALQVPTRLVSRLAAEAERQGIAPRDLALRLIEEGLQRTQIHGCTKE